MSSTPLEHLARASQAGALGRVSGGLELVLRVLIGDDHAIVRKGLREILRDRPNPIEVGEAPDGPAVLEQMQAAAWDLVILDITMPGLTGLEVLRQLRRHYPRVPVLMLSMHTSPVYVARSLEAGAAGYLSKETAPDELLSAIDAALAGRVYVSRAL
ncbi:MAG: response regulator transcription factor [Anaerolineales bacterium]|nr:response regulator transcription factor [Anaerolineales bacterium]